MNSSVSSFFSREKDNSSPKRHALSSVRKHTPLHFLRSSKTEPLQIIPEEEDEPRPSCSSWASSSPRSSLCQTPDLKKRRAVVSPSNIRITKGVNNDFDSDDSLLSAPRPAPRPPSEASPSVSPKSSPDSFRLTFTDTSFKFPHPPIPTPSSSDYHFSSGSPTLSSTSSSPSSQSTGLPLTPSSSDDEFQLSPAPKFNPRRASIRPLNILKHNALPSMFANSPISISDGASDSESESESDSEWYSRELSQVLTLRSALPPSFPKAVVAESARPESLSGSVFDVFPPSPSSKVQSKALPTLPLASPATLSGSRYPSAQLDPAYPRRRSANFVLPNRPPPPPPVPSFYLRSSASSPVSASDEAVPLELAELPERPMNPVPSRSRSLRRPPPRMSIPTDFGFFSEELIDSDAGEEDEGNDNDDGDLLTYYIQNEDFSVPSSSSGSVYSQSSEIEHFSVADLDDEYEFELDVNLDRPMMLPLSLPNSPIDLEADIASGLEQLRLRQEADVPTSVVSEVDLELPPVSTKLTRSASTVARRRLRREMVVSVPVAFDHGFEWSLEEEGEATARAPVIATIPSSPLAAPTFEDNEPSYEEHEFNLEEGGRVLRSRWSSSTLSSIREEQQQHRWRGSKLRLYFGGTKKHSNTSSALLSPITPTTPSKSKSNPKTKAGSKKRTVVVVGPPSSASGSSGWSYGTSLKSPLPMSPKSAVGPMSPYFDYDTRSPTKRSRKQRNSEDGMITELGRPAGVRRRGSTSTTSGSSVTCSSDAASIKSGTSSASSGLRRKPIPVEMFLRA